MSQLIDGHYKIDQIADCIDDDFKNEKDLCDFIERNIESFTKDCIGLIYKNHIREYPLYTTKKRSIKGNRRIDFLITTECGKRIGIECKKPTYNSELASAIGQSLSYLTLFETTDTKIDKIILLSTTVDYVIPLILNKFKLPIDYVCMDKKKFLALVNYDK